VKGFATDALSVDSFRRGLDVSASGVTDLAVLAPVHLALLSREITVIEQLVNLEELVGEDDIVVLGFPLKISEGNGSPVRAAALVY
jgi:kynurenine formamidase